MAEYHHIDPNEVKNQMDRPHDYIDPNAAKKRMEEQQQAQDVYNAQKKLSKQKYVYGYDVIHNFMHPKTSDQRIYDYDVAFSSYLAILNMYKGKGFTVTNRIIYLIIYQGDLHVDIAYSRAKEAYENLTVNEKESIGPMPNIVKCGEINEIYHTNQLRERLENQYQLTLTEEKLLHTQTQALHDYYEDKKK